MTKLVTLSMGLALAVLTMSGTVEAQPVTQVVQGTIGRADCAASTLTLNTDDGAHTFTVSSTTAVYVDSAASGVCALSHYVGTHATVWATGSADQTLAQRVDVGVTPAAPAPYYYYGPSYGCGPLCCGPAYGTYYGSYSGPCLFL
jgi:hypothetical protein